MAAQADGPGGAQPRLVLTNVGAARVEAPWCGNHTDSVVSPGKSWPRIPLTLLEGRKARPQGSEAV